MGVKAKVYKCVYCKKEGVVIHSEKLKVDYKHITCQDCQGFLALHTLKELSDKMDQKVDWSDMR